LSAIFSITILVVESMCAYAFILVLKALLACMITGVQDVCFVEPTLCHMNNCRMSQKD